MQTLGSWNVTRCILHAQSQDWACKIETRLRRFHHQLLEKELYNIKKHGKSHTTGGVSIPQSTFKCCRVVLNVRAGQHINSLASESDLALRAGQVQIKNRFRLVACIDGLYEAHNRICLPNWKDRQACEARRWSWARCRTGCRARTDAPCITGYKRV